MGKVRQLKKRADSVLEEVFRSLFEEIDAEKIRRDVAALKTEAPDFHPIDHAMILVRRTAIRCAAAGALTGLPSGLLAIGSLGADLAYLIYQQFRLIVGIAAIYGHEPSHLRRALESVNRASRWLSSPSKAALWPRKSAHGLCASALRKSSRSSALSQVAR